MGPFGCIRDLPRQAVDMWAGRPPNEDSLIIMRGRLGCITYYARDYARDYARAPTGHFGCILKKNKCFSIMRGALACVTYYARDYERDYARPPTCDFSYILEKNTFSILCAVVDNPVDIV